MQRKKTDKKGETPRLAVMVTNRTTEKGLASIIGVREEVRTDTVPVLILIQKVVRNARIVRAMRVGSRMKMAVTVRNVLLIRPVITETTTVSSAHIVRVIMVGSKERVAIVRSVLFILLDIIRTTMMVNSVHTVRVTTVDSSRVKKVVIVRNVRVSITMLEVITGKVAVRVLPIIIPMRNIA